MPNVLLVDDDPDVRRDVGRILRGMSLKIVEAEDGVDALGKLSQGRFDLVVTDLRMPRAGGFEVLAGVQRQQPSTPVIMLTAHGSISECVQAMRAGAANFVTKPFHLAELERVVRAALDGAGSQAGKTPDKRGPSAVAIIGDSRPLREVLAVVERVATTDANVLLSGETGTGKEVFARLLHGLSPRAALPFVTINCGAIPEGLIESELFGHVKGAFTGASDRRVGKFVQADGGTLFLDEVAELPLAMQVRLLRALQEGEVTPVGDSRSVHVDVRVIAASHRDLEAMSQAGTFREDLMYRLVVVPIELPTLRDRAEDVPLLAQHFLDRAGRRLGRALTIAPEALAALTRYRWPGNVRELENMIERLAVLCKTAVISLDQLPAKLLVLEPATAETLIEPAAADLRAEAPGLPGAGLDLGAALSHIEDSMIDEALRRCGGNKSQAAKLLGLNRTTLIEKLKRRS